MTKTEYATETYYQNRIEALEREVANERDGLTFERDKAERQVEAVRALHQMSEGYDLHVRDGITAKSCTSCETTMWPCPTSIAIDTAAPAQEDPLAARISEALIGTFYQACSPGGVIGGQNFIDIVEAALDGVFETPSRATRLAEEGRDADQHRADIVESLNGLYLCTRHESAWGYGTMSLEDFSPAWEDEDVVQNFVDLDAAKSSAHDGGAV